MRASPWLTEKSIEFLNDFLISNDKIVLEFGMGASTIWLSQRCKFLMHMMENKDLILFNMIQILKDSFILAGLQLAGLSKKKT